MGYDGIHNHLAEQSRIPERAQQFPLDIKVAGERSSMVDLE